MTDNLLELSLPREPGCAARARRWVEGRFSSRVPERALHDLKLVVSELVDNAFVHGRGQITVRAAPVEERIRVEVIDEGQGAAIKLRQDGLELGGWGLRVVDTVSSAWGAYEGTTHVWADVPTSP